MIPHSQDHGIDTLSLGELRRAAGVKKPSVFKRVARAIGGFFNGVNLALAVGPTIGHLLVAREAARAEAAFSGDPEQAPLDWLRENRPDDFSASVATLMSAGSATLQSVMGLSLSDLAEVEEHYYRSLAPELREDGTKTTAPFLRELAKDRSQSPDQRRAAFIFLGKDREQEAESVSKLWNSEQRPSQNPFQPLDPRYRIWDNLEQQAKKGDLPIFVDIDGNYHTFTNTEFVAKKTLSSLGQRNNSLGHGFTETSSYFAWLTERQESFSRDLDPYFQKLSPENQQTLKRIKADLAPPWLDGKAGMGPWSAPQKLRQMPDSLEAIRRSGVSEWVDALVSLDRDVLTGVQSHWIKLLRELKREDRDRVLAPLPTEHFRINLLEPDDPDFFEVSPSNAPSVLEVVPGDKITRISQPYDRSIALKETLDHTLDGLGIIERRRMLSELKTLGQENLGGLEAREARLQQALGQSYSGLDVKAVLDGEASQQDLNRGLKDLRAWAKSAPRTVLGMEARRHASMLEFLYQMDNRYGEVDQILSRIKGDFSEHGLGVSEYFIVPEAGTKVTPLRSAAQSSSRLGNPTDPKATKLSLVFEGGGGRGFAYPECLKQLETALAGSQQGYDIDEYIGTSAGSIGATLLAAGYTIDEIPQVMESIDFTSFNTDAAWLMGGVDPKVRGINRTGLFSTQKMYQTMQELLSKKLGIEGRPVLFSDLPHKLKLVTAVMNTDLAEDSSLREHLDGDGRFTFSSENTPNFDVVGAMTASSAVPGFFQLPQILVAQPGEKGEVTRSRMQFGDGGIVDNMSISSASRKEDKRSLLVLPAHTHTRHPITGEYVGLDTLNFSTDNLDLVDAHNQRLYQKFAPKLDEYFQRMKDSGAERAVIAFNLTKPWQQTLSAVQGNSEELSLKAMIHAEDLGMPILDKEKGDSIIDFSLRPRNVLTDSAASLFDTYIDNRPDYGDGTGDFHRNSDGFHYHPPSDESADIFEMGWATGGIALAASHSEYEARRFEAASKK